jgi:hypothetical protein
MKYALATCFAVSSAIAPVQAADSSYLGVWKVAGAVVAPWADPRQKPDSAEQARLLGKIIAFKAKEITGPRPFACATPHYKISDFTADLILRGAFEGMQ